ncbi:MAG: hypothetical protein ACRDDC_08655 [Tannerellaceae bacterium]
MKTSYVICFFLLNLVGSLSAKSVAANCEKQLKQSLETFLADKNLKNAADFSDVSVAYVGEIKDSVDLYMYADTLSCPSAAFATMGMGAQEVNNERTSWVEIKPCTAIDLFYQSSRDDIMRVAVYVKGQLSMAYDMAKVTLQIGYNVFSVKFKYQDRAFETFLFYDDNCTLKHDQVFKFFPKAEE